MTPANVPRSSSWRRVAGAVAVLAFLALTGLTFYRCARVYHVPTPKDTSHFGLCDFHNAVYFPGLAYARGENPYLKAYAERYPVNREMSPYSPLLLPFAAVFGVLPLRLAEVLWCVLNVAATLAVADVVCRALGWRRTVAGLFGVGALLVATRSGHSNLILGQVAAPMLLATCYALRHAKESPWRSAAGLAVATIKPTFGVPLAILMAARGDYAACIRGVALGVAGGAAAFSWIALSGGGGLSESLTSSHDAIVVDEDVDPTSAWMRTDLMAVVSRSLGVTPGAAGELALMLLVLAPACVLFWRTAHATGTPDSESRPRWPGLSDALVLTLLPLAIYHLAYDALLVAPVVGALVGREGSLRHAAPTWARWSTAALVAAPTMNYLTTWSVMQRLGVEGLAKDVVLAINPACLTLAALALGAMACRPRTTATPTPQPL